VLQAVIIAGVNGAGKTSFARRLLPRLHPGVKYLNPDEIRTKGPALIHPISADREILHRLAESERRRASFAIETTLSSTMYARRARAWKAAGYFVLLHFIEVPSEHFAVRRVARRVAEGGHGVPEADIHRRHHRGLSLLDHVYKPLVDEWYHWNTDDRGLHLVDHEKKSVSPPRRARLFLRHRVPARDRASGELGRHPRA
jgi:predicted ABC-type ATPase